MTDRVLDQWAGLNHKSLMSPTGDVRISNLPTWVPRDESRRLNAYRILWAYRANTAKEFVEADTDEERMARREYGDADLLVRQTAAAIIGRGASLRVTGSNRPPEEPPEGADPAQVDEYKRIKDDYPQIVQRQREMDKWALDEQWALRLNSAEEDAQCLGDAVYWLTFSTKRKRARLRTLDPGFYFPVYQVGADAEDYPDKVHLAWEEEDPGLPDGMFGKATPTKWVRRITYELLPSEPWRPPYAAADSELSTQRCVMTDARWDMGRFRGNQLDLDPSTAVYSLTEDGEVIDQLDIGIDFIPIVHLPNMGGSPWGTSLLLSIAAVLDDLQIADTDASDASSVAGGPPIAVAGVAQGQTLAHYGPRTVWELPSGGGASVLDTSKGLESLHTQQDRLFARAATNARVPEEILGKVSANDVPSGLALALSFGPFEVMVEQARLVRSFKYELLLKMVQRIHIANGVWEGQVFPAGVEFGSALPSDFSSLTDILLKLTGSKALMSRSTAVQALANAGLPIDDVPIEIDRIEGEDHEGANMLYRATRSPAIAAEYLRLDLPEDVLMEQLGKVLQREVRLDEVRELFDQKKAAEDAAKVVEAERLNAQRASQRMEGATVARNAPDGGGGNRGRNNGR